VMTGKAIGSHLVLLVFNFGEYRRLSMLVLLCESRCVTESWTTYYNMPDRDQPIFSSKLVKAELNDGGC